MAAAWAALGAGSVAAGRAVPGPLDLLLTPSGAVAAAVAVAVGALSLRRGAAPGSVVAADDRAQQTLDAPLLAHVMPVWQQQLQSARNHADSSANSMLEAFGEIDSRLDQAIQLTEQAQGDVIDLSVDDLVQNNQAALDQLLAPMRQALASRDHALRQLDAITDEMRALREAADQVRKLAKRTSMVALNASVEASRAGERGSGFATVAQEVRALAMQSGDTGASMLKLTSKLEASLNKLRSQTVTQDSSDEALRADADAHARAALSGLLHSLSDVNRSTRGLREAGQAVRDQVERTLVGFQSQDRLNQMLGSIVDDIERMHQWLAQGGDISATQANVWLERLEASYTMEDQRSLHHGQTVIERSSSVDFF